MALATLAPLCRGAPTPVLPLQSSRPLAPAQSSRPPHGTAAAALFFAAYARRTLVRRRALSLQLLESGKADVTEAVAEVAAGANAAGARFALLTVPGDADMATASQQLRQGLGLAGNAPLLALQGDKVSLGLFSGDSDVKAFFVNKEELSQAGAGLARENPVPGVPDGGHGSVLVFADPKVPGALTRNLLEALDARYPAATTAGVVALPVKGGAAVEEDWEPPRTGRQLRTRDRSDGHGWMKGDPGVNAADATASLTVEFKRRPFGVKRYAPGIEGKGAMIMDMQEKGRYKGDAMGQSADKGVKLGMVLTEVNGTDVRTWDFEDIMDLLNDQGIMDPDSKSAATWGDAGKGVQRQPVPEATLPLTASFAEASGGGGGGAAPLCLDGMPKKEGVMGLALSAAATSSLDLVGCRKLGPALEVTAAGANPEGGLAVAAVKVNGKEMPAAAALKGYAQAGGLKSMQGISVGIARPTAGECPAAQWAVFPMVGVTKKGGLVLRCKGLAAEGLGASDDALKSVQFFAPAATEKLAGAGGALLSFATGKAAEAAPPGAFSVPGAAVIGAAGTGAGRAGTVLHRQAATLVSL